MNEKEQAALYDQSSYYVWHEPKHRRLARSLAVAIVCLMGALALLYAGLHGQHRQCRILQHQHAPQWQQDRVCR